MLRFFGLFLLSSVFALLNVALQGIDVNRISVMDLFCFACHEMLILWLIISAIAELKAGLYVWNYDLLILSTWDIDFFI